MSIVTAAILLAGCQQATRSSSQWLSYTGPDTNRGGVAYCRSGLTGLTYTMNGAACSPGDVSLSAAEMSTKTEVPTMTLTQSAIPPKPQDAACKDHVESGSRRYTAVPELLRLLAAQKSQKDEFETTRAYQARVDGQASAIKASLRSKTGTESVIVSMPLKADGAKYDADRQVLTVGADPSPVQTSRASNGGVYHTVLITDVIERDLDTYIGENAYGAKRKVTKLSQRNGGIVVGRANSILDANTWPSKGWSRSFNMPADEARATKANLRLLVIGSLNAPFLLTGYDGANPTISSPIDITTVTHAVNIVPECIVLYDARAQKVLHTF
ncbi:hypothetical protein [Azospirillum griseum]|uniref:Uncharacterized protein n=1 Tax=Azospirillum griseum TaxID=2496639 RepID=A0A431V9U3_9PROT|nr:hypothetical protein [Azospirillum griseum]RTR12740.1 hypothetical protein EJ903_25305 [Azospirillum griseum]